MRPVYENEMRYLLGCAGAALVIVGALFWFSSPKWDEKLVPEKILLNEDQKKELPLSEGGLLPIGRKRQKVWVSGQALSGYEASEVLGYLHKIPSLEVDLPLYECLYLEHSGNRALDASAQCLGEGTRQDKTPLGYSSRQIRTGFQKLYRCKSSTLGMYASTNPKCEDPKDRLQGDLGSIRMTH